MKINRSEFRHLHYLFALVFFTALSMFIYSTPLFQTAPHYLTLSRDLEIPTYLDNLIGTYYPMWSGVLSATNFINTFQIDVLGLLFIARYLNLQPMTAVELVMVVATLLSGFCGYVATYVMLSKTYGSSNNKIILASLLAGLFMVANPHWAADPRHYGRKIADAFIPLVFVLFWMGFREKRLSYILGGAIVFVLYTAAPRNLIAGVSVVTLLCVYSIVTDILKNKSRLMDSIHSILVNIKLLLIAGAFCFLLSAFRFFPLIYRTITTGFPTPYLNTVESAQQGSASATLVNLLRFDVYPTHQTYQSAVPVFQAFTQGPWQQIIWALPIVIFIIALGVLIIGPRNRDTILLIANLLLWTVFSTGVNPLGFPYVPSLYYWLLFRAPLNQYLFWAFRYPIEFWVLPLTFAGILVGVFVFKVLNTLKVESPSWCKVLGVLVIVIVLTSTLLPAWPMFTGNFGGVLQPVHIPDPYYNVNNWLNQQAGDFKVVWLPIYSTHEFITPALGQTARWGSVPWLQNQTNPDLATLGIKNFDMISSSRDSYSVWVVVTSKGRPIETYLVSLLSNNYINPLDIIQSNRTSRLGQMFAPLGVRYLILDTDIPTQKAVSNVIQILGTQADLRIAYEDGFMYVYENSDYAPRIYTAPDGTLVEGGTQVMTALSNFNFFNATASPIFFLDQQVQWQDQVLKSADTLVLHDGGGLLPLVYSSGVIQLTLSSPHSSSSFHSDWGTASSTDTRYGVWTSVLAAEHIANWDFDYGVGFVFTDRPNANMTIPVAIKADDDYVVYVRYLSSPSAGQFRVLIDGVEAADIHTLSNSSTFVEYELGTQHMNAGGHVFSLQNDSGFNAVNYLLLIPKEKFDQYHQQLLAILQEKQLLYMELPGQDLQYVQATVESTYGGNALNGVSLTFQDKGTAWTSIEPLGSGTYAIAIDSPDPQRGTLVVRIANYTFTVTPHADRLAYLPGVNLEARPYVLRVSQQDGRPVIDGVFVYTADGGGDFTMNRLFSRASPASVISYKKVDPTKYLATVDAKAPFWLLLAESYDPDWVAFVNGQPVTSNIAYQSINAYHVNATGRVDIVIEFVLQRYFAYGEIVAGLSLVVVLALIIVDTRMTKRKDQTPKSAAET